MAHLTGFRQDKLYLLLILDSFTFFQDVFETKDEIEEVNRKLLEKLLDENEFVAVYFCKFSASHHL